MRLVLVHLLIVLLCLPSGLSGQNHAEVSITDAPAVTPSLTGPDTPCEGSTNNFYTTDPGQTLYTWVVSAGGIITSGSGTSSIQVTWQTGWPPDQTISVSYTGSTIATMNVVVAQSLAVSVSIVASANPVCAGTPVTYTATPVNGGTTPAYQWQVNGINITGATNVAYTYTPANNNTITCILTSSELCTTVNPALSNAVVMTVNPLLPVSISIAASSNPACAGVTVNYTSTTFNGGTVPGYQWRLNGVNVSGATDANYSFIPANSDKITCVLNSNAECVSANPATSNEINMTVSPSLPVAVSIVASAYTSCPGNLVTFTATPTNGGSSPVYNWFVNGILIGTNSPAYSYTPVSGDLVTCVMTSSAGCTTGNPASSNEITMTVAPYAPVSISITASANPSCNGIPVTFTATAVNGGTLPEYAWVVNGTGVGTNNPVFTYTPTQGDVVSCMLNSNELCATGNPANSNSIFMNVSPSGIAGVSITSSNNPVCQGTLVTYTATPVNGGTAPEYQWSVNGVNAGSNGPVFSYVPENGEVVTCAMVSNSLCSTGNPASSNPIVMSVSPVLAVSISIAAQSNPVCQGSSVIFTSTSINGGSTPSYQWKVNGGNVGTNSSIYTYLPADNDVVTCTLNSSAMCTTGNPAVSDPVTMSVSASLTAEVSIVASANPACTGVPVEFTATAVNGGTNPVYEWRVDNINMPGATNSTYSYSATSAYTIKCILTSNNGCPPVNTAVSNVISMGVTDLLPVSVSVEVSANPSCQEAFITFIATPENGGTSPHFQWKVNGINAGSDGPAYTYSPITGDNVTCELTSSALCAANNPSTSTPVIMTVYPIVTPTISVTTPDNPVCPGTQVAFTAVTSNGGTSPVYQWMKNGINIGTNNPVLNLIPIDGDLISCKLTSSLLCVTGNPVTSAELIMHTNSPLPGSISISASANPFCQGSTVTFSSSILNGGGSPVYQWKKNGIVAGGNSPAYSYIPVNGDYITCTLTSSLTCTTGPVTSNPILMLVQSTVPASISIAASENPVCVGNSVTFNATPVNGGSIPAYQWKINGVNAGTNSSALTYVPTDGDFVTCILTSNAGCVSGSPATSSPVIMAVSSGMPASVSIITGTNPFCQGTSVNFTATPVNGGPTPLYQWQVNGINMGPLTGNPVFTYIPANNDVVTCLLTSNASCISGTNPVLSNQIMMTEAASLPVGVTIAASVNPACQGTPVTFTATPVNGGNTPLYQWIVDGSNISGATNATYTFGPTNGNVITCMATSDLGCASGNPAVSPGITMTIIATVMPSVSITPSVNPACAGTLVTFTASVSNGGPSPGFVWRVNGVVVSGATNSSYSYVPQLYDVVTCQLTSNAECNIGIPVLSNQVAMMVNAEQYVGVIITTPSLSFCAGSQITFTATAVNGGTSPTYQWQVQGVPQPGATNSTYTYQPVNGDVVTCVLWSNQTCIVNASNPATSNSLLMVTGSLTPGISISADHNQICPGTSVVFTAVPVNGGPSPSYQWKKNGINTGNNQSTYEYAPLNGDQISCVLTSNLSCIAGATATSDTVIMIVNPAIPVSVVVTAATNPSCLGATVCYFAEVVNGGTFARYRWIVNNVVKSSLINNPSYCYEPVDGDIVKCQVISDTTCPTPNPCTSVPVVMVVLPISAPSVVVSAPGNLVCEETVVTFTATPFFGGSAPAYQWKVNTQDVDGATDATYSYAPMDSDEVTSQMTSNASCISSSTVLSLPFPVTVTPNIPVSVSIVSLTNPVCQGMAATFIATPLNGGSIPAYQWMVNGINSGINSSAFVYIPVDGDVVSCQLTSNVACTTGNPAISNQVTVSVLPTIPVSITIEPSSTPLCQGQSITYTSTAVNGGTNPLYQWLVNGMIVGGNTSTYTYVPSSGDAVACHLTSDIICATGNPALSNEVVMNFPPYLPVSISITCPTNPVCEGIQVTFNAAPVNGGATPAYQWKNNGISINGATNAVFSNLPVTGNVITCELTSSETCTNNNPATSNSITMSVLPIKISSVTIVPSVNPVCEGNEVTFTAFPVNGGSSPVYQWYKNGTPAGSGLSTFTFVPVDGDQVYCMLTTSITCVTQPTATSNTVTVEVEQNIDPTVSIAASAFPACENQPVLFTATAQYVGVNPVYQWIVNGFNVGSNSPGYTYVPTEGDQISCQFASSYSCATAVTVTSNVIIMEVDPMLQISILIDCQSNPVCQGDAVTFTASPVNGGTSPAYQWKNNGIDMIGATNVTMNYVPANNDVITCELTSSETCVISNQATSNTFTMMVASSFDVSVAIATLDNPACVGTEVTFTATPFFGGNLPSYKWFVNNIEQPGETTSTFSFYPDDGDLVECSMTSQLSCGTPDPAISNGVTMAVFGTPVGASITADPVGPVCAGTVITYTCFPVNGGTGPTFQWNVNGVPVPATNNPVFNYAPSDLESITCTLNSNATCILGNTVTSEPIIASVFPVLPVSVEINTSTGNVICSGTIVTFITIPVNEGTSPQYQWIVNGSNVPGATNPTYQYSPLGNDEISCMLTSSVTCATGNPAISNPVIMTVNPVEPVSVVIDATDMTVCEGTTVTFTATPANGGASPAYQWKINDLDIPGATDAIFAYVPANNDAITCVLTSDITCPSGNPATSNTLTMMVDPIVQVSILISASAVTVCEGTQVTFDATPSNGGTIPSYQWRINAIDINGATDAIYSFIPLNNDAITCVLNSNAPCPEGSPATSNTVNMTVNMPEPVSVTIESSANTVCAGTMVSSTATPVNGGTTPAYQWKLNNVDINGATDASYSFIPLNNDVLSCEITSNAVCPVGNPAVSNTVTMTVNPVVPVSVVIDATEITVCEGTPVTFTATPSNGGTSPSFQWKVNNLDINGATDATWSNAPVNNDAVTCILTSSETCPTGNPATSNVLTMTVDPVVQVSVTIAASAITVCAGTQVTFEATPSNGGTIPGYQWKVNNIDINGATGAIYSYIPLNNDAVTCVLISGAACPQGSPATSNLISITVNALEPVSILIEASAGAVCEGTMVLYTATPSNGGPLPQYQWKVNNIDIMGATNATWSYVPVNNDAITCILTSNALCPTGNPAASNTLTMTVDPSFPVGISIVANPPGTLCSGIPITYSATILNGGSLPQYQWKVNGGNVGANLPSYTYQPADNDIITCELTSDLGCTTGNPATSNQLVASISTAPLVTYTVCHDVETAINGKPFRLRGGLPLGGIYSGNGVNSLTSMFDPLVAGVGIHTVTYTYTNSELCTATSSLNINNHDATLVNCSNPSFNDIRDGQVYPIVQLGSQCWFAANLNYGIMSNSSDPQTDNCTNDKYCLNNSEANCMLYGGLYQWDEMMRHGPAMDGHQGLCPPGWHVPDNAEWAVLFDFYGGQSEAGTSLKIPGPGSFNTLLGGVLYQDHTAWSYYLPDFTATFFWTSDPVGLWQATSHGLNSKVASVSDYQSGRGNGFSVRCLLDSP